MEGIARRKSGAERMRSFRERIKLNKIKHEEYKEKERIRNRRARLKMNRDPEKKKENRRRNTEYVRLYRAKKKAQREQDGPKKKTSSTPRSGAAENRYTSQVGVPAWLWKRSKPIESSKIIESKSRPKI